MILSISGGQTVLFTYKNHRGVTETRSVEYLVMQYGSNEYHPEPQWFLHGICKDRNALRSFALKDIDILTIEVHW